MTNKKNNVYMNNSLSSESGRSTYSNSSSEYNNNNTNNQTNNASSNQNNILSHLLPSSMINTFNNFNSKQQQILSNFNNNDTVENNLLYSKTSSQTKMSIVNLNEIIEKYACKFFKENERDFQRKMGKNYGWKELVKEIDFKKLKVRNEDIQYKDLEAPGAPKSHVLFRSTFINDSAKEQDYLLRTERKTTSSCSIDVFEGFVTESSAEISIEIPLPSRILSAGAGLRREYTLEHSTNKCVQEELTWSIESNVRVPSMTKTTAELLVQEDQYKGIFELKTYFHGSTTVKLYKENQLVLSMDLGDLDEIFSRDKGFKKDQKGIFYITKGECKARFGIEQKIELHQTPLKQA